MALIGPLDDHVAVAHASTTSTRDLAGDSGWVNHLTVTFTTTVTGPIECHFAACHGWETGAVNLLGRFRLDQNNGNLTTECQIFKQGFNYNMAFGSHNCFGIFDSVAAGSHTIELQVRNPQSGTTGRMVGFNPGSHAADRMQIIYRG